MSAKSYIAASVTSVLLATGQLALAQTQLAQTQNNPQAAPSQKPASDANTAAVSGSSQHPTTPSVGNQPAAPSPLPAGQATTKAEEERKTEPPK